MPPGLVYTEPALCVNRDEYYNNVGEATEAIYK